MKTCIRCFVVFISAIGMAGCTVSGEEYTGFYVRNEKNRIDLFLGDQLITSYLFADSLQKPVFYPVKSPSGFEFTRAYPLREKAGESTDHLHHIGVWFSYGEVNGVDFWTSTWENYDGVNPRQGKISHQQVETHVEDNRAIFAARSYWNHASGDTLITETSVTEISYLQGHLIFDRNTTLVANEDIHFHDSKEGMYAIRVAKCLEEDIENPGRGGTYLNSEELTGADVWGQQARWVILESQSCENPASVLFIDHPENPGYPAHWMARGYGLFAVNPLGKATFTEGRDSLNLKVKKADSVTFRYRLVLTAAKEMTDEQLQSLVEEFTEQEEF